MYLPIYTDIHRRDLSDANTAPPAEVAYRPLAGVVNTDICTIYRRYIYRYIDASTASPAEVAHGPLAGVKN